MNRFENKHEKNCNAIAFRIGCDQDYDATYIHQCKDLQLLNLTNQQQQQQMKNNG